jgi:ABC-type Fe3+ transport system substrate-binding protein
MKNRGIIMRRIFERGILALGAPQGAAKRFLDFAASSEGQKILSQHRMIPVL